MGTTTYLLIISAIIVISVIVWLIYKNKRLSKEEER